METLIALLLFIIIVSVCLGIGTIFLFFVFTGMFLMIRGIIDSFNK